MRVFNKSFLVILTSLVFSQSLFPCTTAIVSGKFTKNGKPLLYKHRDSGFEQNKIMYFSDGKYSYLALVNSADSLGEEVWGGTNSEGFSIINSASYNLKPKSDTTSGMDREGIVMKLALQSCATIEDFQNLLNDLSKPLGVEANFGVIDAKGGAAYYETNNFSFTKIDVNDLNIAPFGYVIRTNYSFNGDSDEGYGYIRYQQANELFYDAAACGNLSAKFIIQDVSRCLKHALTEEELSAGILPSSSKPKFVNFQDFIPRSSSVSSVIIEGVRENEDPAMTTLWTVLGFQLCSVAVPSWVAGGKKIPKILAADASGKAPLCEKALKLKDECFPIKRGSGKRYLNLSALLNRENTGILQKLAPIEKKIFEESSVLLSDWGKGRQKSEGIAEFYSWVSEYVITNYYHLFGL